MEPILVVEDQRPTKLVALMMKIISEFSTMSHLILQSVTEIRGFGYNMGSAGLTNLRSSFLRLCNYILRPLMSITFFLKYRVLP